MTYFNTKMDDIKLLEKENYPKKQLEPDSKVSEDIESFIKDLGIKDGDTLSFHHHLRNGDKVLIQVMEEIHKLGIKDLTIAASSLFPSQEKLVPMIEDGTVTNIVASYISGPIGQAISAGKLQGRVIMQSHGGRARAILEDEIKIDYAFIASPSSDKRGNISGVNGEASCGAMGYAIADSIKANVRIAVTDYLADFPNYPADITQDYIDHVLLIDTIGDKEGIVSGTTMPTKDPVGLKIAENTLEAMIGTGLVKDGLSFQTGAGGISLAVAEFLSEYMEENEIVGSFASGGITGFLVDMLEKGQFQALYDVQCFDLQAIESLKNNANHLRMSGSLYGNPNVTNVVDDLDIVILGATEIDKDFNVNVTTGSDGVLMGGSGGHQDTAYGAKVSIIVSKLFSSRIPFIKDRVDVITTPGNTIDILVTEHGICINPLRTDLIEKFQEANIETITMEDLKAYAEEVMGKPKEIEKTDKIVGLSQSRTGEILDYIYQVK